MSEEILYGFPEREKKPKLDRGWLKKQLQAGASVRKIAEESGYSRQAIYDVIKRYNLKVISRNELHADWVRKQKALGRSDRDIAEELGLSRGTIRKIRAKHNIQNSKSSSLNRRRIEIDPKWLAGQKKKGRSDRDIAEELGCHVGTVFQKRKQLGIGPMYHRK